MYTIIHYLTKEIITPKDFVFTSPDSPWEIQMDIEAIKATLSLDYFKQEPPSFAKYLPLMPIKSLNQFDSLGEIATPLVKSKLFSGIDLYFKVEGKNPTGSFKDRGSAVDVAVAKELGAKAVILASTGNMAASCACFATAAQIPCFILMPEGVALSKLAQVMAFDGHMVQVKGTYNDAVKLAETMARKMGFYLAGDYAFRVEGQKTAAFEIIDQLFFHAPDVVIVPMGCGTNISAYYKGFKEYQQLGLINKMPQLIGVEASGAAAIVNSFNMQQKTITALNHMDTLASAIAIPNPIDGVKALDAIYNSQGRAIAVSDEEILAAQHLLSAHEGLFVETSSAATVAALQKLVLEPDFQHKKIVCILTGDGLKDANVVFNSAATLPLISPNENEFIQLYKEYL